MQVLLKYLKLCKDNTILLIIGLFFGSISSYYKVYTKEYLSIMLNGDISVFDIYIKYCIITVISTAIRCGIFTYTQNSFYNKLNAFLSNRHE